MSAWSALLAGPCLRASPPIQLPYALQWVAMESAGNPCAVGNPAEHGPDGLPREVGIVQLYNPDDLASQGATAVELRAYCVPGDQHEVVHKGRRIRGFSQDLLYPLSQAQMQRQADLTAGLISRAAIRAAQELTSAGAGPAWSPARRSFWAMTKLQHGLPRLVRYGLPAVTKKLGRPPASWQEFRATLATTRLDPETEASRGEFGRVLNNAQRCASAFVEQDVA